MESPIIVRKSPAGLFLTYLVGGALTAGLLLGFVMSMHRSGLGLADTEPKVLLLITLVVVLATFVQAHVYLLSRIEMNNQELRFVHWLTMWSNQVANCDWRDILDVQVRQGGLGRTFGYGTVVVRRASGAGDLRIPMIPNAEHWREVILTRADRAGRSSEPTERP
jgi:membrane protein YdbS with pleckstrin-like domain